MLSIKCIFFHLGRFKKNKTRGDALKKRYSIGTTGAGVATGVGIITALTGGIGGVVGAGIALSGQSGKAVAGLTTFERRQKSESTAKDKYEAHLYCMMNHMDIITTVLLFIVNLNMGDGSQNQTLFEMVQRVVGELINILHRDYGFGAWGGGAGDYLSRFGDGELKDTTHFHNEYDKQKGKYKVVTKYDMKSTPPPAATDTESSGSETLVEQVAGEFKGAMEKLSARIAGVETEIYELKNQISSDEEQSDSEVETLTMADSQNEQSPLIPPTVSPSMNAALSGGVEGTIDSFESQASGREPEPEPEFISK